MVSLAARGIHTSCMKLNFLYSLLATLCTCIIPAPPTPTEVTTWFVSASSFRVAWQWTSSSPAPDCFNTTHVTYHPEGGSELSLQLSDPAATEATLTDLQCNTNYTITVVATAGEHRRDSLTLQGELYTVMHVEVCMFFNGCPNYTGTTIMCPEDSGKFRCLCCRK